jgi:hypothetical protein
MIRDVHPGSRILILIFTHPEFWSKEGIASRIRIRNIKRNKVLYLELIHEVDLPLLGLHRTPHSHLSLLPSPLRFRPRAAQNCFCFFSNLYFQKYSK